MLAIKNASFREFNFSTEQLIYCQRNDPALQDIINDCLSYNTLGSQGFYLDNEVLYKRKPNGQELIVVPYDLVEDLLKFYHNSDLILHL